MVVSGRVWRGSRGDERLVRPPACTRGRAATEGCATAPAGAERSSGMSGAHSTFGASRPRGKCVPKIAKAVIASASASFRALPRAPFDTRHGRGIAHPHTHAFAGELGQPQCVGVTASIKGIRISRARAGHGDNPHPYRPVRVSDPSNARGGSGARGARHGGAAASEPSPGVRWCLQAANKAQASPGPRRHDAPGVRGNQPGAQVLGRRAAVGQRRGVGRGDFGREGRAQEGRGAS